MVPICVRKIDCDSEHEPELNKVFLNSSEMILDWSSDGICWCEEYRNGQ